MSLPACFPRLPSSDAGRRQGSSCQAGRAPLSQDGFTLVEVLVAGVIGPVRMLGVGPMAIGANARAVAVRGREGATNVQRELVERARSVAYVELTQGSIYARMQALPGLEDSSADPGYQIRRRGFTYTVTLGVCSVDDPKDSYGPHDGSFCAGGGPGTTDTNPDDYKVISLDVTWSQGNGHGHSRQQALVNSPGAKVGPSVAGIAIDAGTNNVIATEVSTVNVSVTTSFAANTVNVAVDGDAQGAATGTGTSWTWPWAIGGLVDGTYLLGARAFDVLGRSGPSRSLTVTLNRRLALAPTGAAAGRNGSVVEIEWLANAERDIAGYRVFRSSSVVSSCSFTTKTSCQDTSPPSGVLTYTVKALDRNTAGALREGASSTTLTVTSTNLAPYPPTMLAASTSSGNVVLTWQAVSPADPDSGDSIAFYRIYRDGTAVANRYDRTGQGTDLTWTDPGGAEESHTYRVTAVDTQLAESPFVGPVTP